MYQKDSLFAITILKITKVINSIRRYVYKYIAAFNLYVPSAGQNSGPFQIEISDETVGGRGGGGGVCILEIFLSYGQGHYIVKNSTYKSVFLHFY
jgi:hypothetical protein